MTAYGSDCLGCSGITSSGYNVKNTIYYQDKEYGNVNIIAADKSIPFGTIIEFQTLNQKFIAITLDRGGAIGFNQRSQFDLLLESEAISYNFGVQEVSYKILRTGY